MSTFRSHFHHDSSSSPESLSAVFRMRNPAAATAADMDDDARVMELDDSSSPSPESHKPVFPDRRGSKFPPASARRTSGIQTGLSSSALAKAAKSSGKSSASTSKSASVSSAQSPGNPIIPRRAEDWEPWKGILHELYITQNRILRDIIIMMEDNYNLRATPKMYKNQFARWNFFKYSIKRRPRNKSTQESESSQSGALVSASRSPVDGLISPLLHDSTHTRIMQAGLGMVRDFLKVYINIDPTAPSDMVVYGYEDPCFRYFKASMDLFDQGENAQAGLLLRRAFLQIERMLSTMTIKAFSDLCFLIPHLLVESNRPDILSAYLRYLSGLAAAKFGTHPITDVIASLADFIDDPESMMRYIMTLSKVNSDTLSDLEGAQERTRKWARLQYLACQKTNLDLGDPSDDKDSKHPHHMLRVEAQSVYWAQHLVMGDPESDRLAELWMSRDFPDDFVPRCEAYIAQVKGMGEAKILPPEYARMMECLYIGWLNDYYETIEDWPKVFEYGRRGLELAAGEQYQVWSIHLESLMREHGSAEEAEEMRRRRLEHSWFETVRQEIEDMSLSSV